MGVAAAQDRMADALARRKDRFSQLLARASSTEKQGNVLLTKSALTAEEYVELERLTPDAHRGFEVELVETVGHLRTLLAAADPFYVLAVLQDLNLFVPWGEYYEPTNEGLESRLELAASLVASQPGQVRRDRPTPAAMQTIVDEIDHALLVAFLFNLTQRPPEGDPALATLRTLSAMRWMSLRGDSYPGHGEALAEEVYGPEEGWLVSRLGFAVTDLLKVGDVVSGLRVERRNALGQAAADAANAELTNDDMQDVDQNEAMRRSIMTLLAVRQDGIRDTATVTAALIADRDPTIPLTRAEAVLRELSVPVGSIDPSAYRGPFDQTPLRTRPFLEYENEYLLALPGALTRDVDRLLESRLLADNRGFSKRRARTLDRLALEYLARMLPGATTYANVFYGDAETDGLVLFERTAIVVEGKASGISPQGQRGDLVRLQRDLEDAVEDAWRQGARAR